jgi:hypothetical protein
MLHGVKFYLFIDEEEEEEAIYAHAFCLGCVHTVSLHSNMNMHL